VFVLSSHSEGLSNTILEAMASRLPVVATDVGGADELVIDGETGMLVTPGAVPALADALDAMLSNPAAARAMGEAGRRRVESDFTLEGMIRRYERLYREVAAAAKRSPMARPAPEQSGAA
jgi:glycosyltransferase involved in cell wall biosynthesis